MCSLSKEFHFDLWQAVEDSNECFAVFSSVRDENNAIIDFSYEYINKAGCRDNQIPREEVLGRTLLEVLPNYKAYGLFDKYSNLVETGEPLVIESTHFNDNYGKKSLSRAFDINASKSGDGFVVTWRETTKARAIKEDLRRLASIVEFSNEIVIGLNPDFTIFAWSKGAEIISGYSAKDAFGSPISLFIPQENQEDAALIFGKVFNGERIENFEVYAKTKVNSGILLSVAASPIHDSNEQMIGVSIIGRDITNRRQIEEELNRRNVELKEQRAEAIEASRLKSQFLANMSHELRTPLNSIIGFTTRVIKKCQHLLPKMQLDNLEIVQDEASHLLELINNLLDYSKIESGKMEVHTEEFDLLKVVDEVNTMINSLIEGKSVKYEQEFFTNEIIPIKSDRIKLKQILINLLSNAFKYSEKGTVKLVIDKIDDSYYVKVQDEGLGIAPENVRHVFDEFRQVDGTYTRKVGGTGLGLSITKSFVELLCGRITLVSTLGIGSCFTICIPTDLECVLDRSGHEMEHVHREYYSKKVVCVDDDPNSHKLYKQYLNEHGFESIAFYGDEDIVNNVKEIMPDIIILDILLPVKDGWEILVELKSNPETSSIPVIMASLLSEKNLAYKLKADEYLIKPVFQDELIEAISRTILKKDVLYNSDR